jgi:hypothetical protein
MAAEGKVSDADLGLLELTDSPEEVLRSILDSGQRPHDATGFEEEAREATRRALGGPPPSR